MTDHDDGPLPERVRQLGAPLAQAAGIEILDVEISGPATRPLIRVIVDTAEVTAGAAVDVDDIATVSRELGNRLDEDVLLDAAYTLEVTSPGADRPLTDRRDFARNLGRDVRIERRISGDHRDSEATEEVSGALIEVDHDHLTIEVEGSEVAIGFADLVQGRVVLPW